MAADKGRGVQVDIENDVLKLAVVERYGKNAGVSYIDEQGVLNIIAGTQNPFYDRQEILGLAGVDGNGQKELCEVITGLRPVLAGEIILDGVNLAGKKPKDFIVKMERLRMNSLSERDIQLLKRAIEISINSRKHGNTPFGCLLADASGNILLEQESIEISTHDCTGHAETALMRRASQQYSKDFLWTCTLISTVEPCAMCSGAIYWGNVGRVVYALDESELLKLTGDDPQNPTFSLPCRQVFAHGQKKIQVIGPVPELYKNVLEVHEGYWK